MGSQMSLQTEKYEKFKVTYDVWYGIHDDKAKLINPRKKFMRDAFLFSFAFKDDIKDECINFLNEYKFEGDEHEDINFYICDDIIVGIEQSNMTILSSSVDPGKLLNL